MTPRILRLLVVFVIAVAAMMLPIFDISGQMPARAPRYAITNARIVTLAGAPIDKGTVVMRDGVIEEVGSSVATPADALVVDGSGLVVYPGAIDMSNSTIVEGGIVAAAAADIAPVPTGRGRGTTVATPDTITWADQEREARTRYLHPDVDASRIVVYDGDPIRRIAAAGITSALAVPAQGIIRGQSALVNITAPPDPSEISAVGTYRRGSVVVRSARETIASSCDPASRASASSSALARVGDCRKRLARSSPLAASSVKRSSISARPRSISAIICCDARSCSATRADKP